jgi:hypothetical protein
MIRAYKSTIYNDIYPNTYIIWLFAILVELCKRHPNTIEFARLKFWIDRFDSFGKRFNLL